MFSITDIAFGTCGILVLVGMRISRLSLQAVTVGFLKMSGPFSDACEAAGLVTKAHVFGGGLKILQLELTA